MSKRDSVTEDGTLLIDGQTIPERIQYRLNVLEGCLIENVHITQTEDVQRLLNKIAQHDHMLSDEDRAYCHSAQNIIDSGKAKNNKNFQIFKSEIVLLKKGKRGVQETVFLEPSTGRHYNLDDSPYLMVDSVFNH